MKGICPYCGEPLEDNLEEHLEENHFMGVRDFYESGELLLGSSEKCLKCGSHRLPLSLVYGANNYFLPCWRCIGDDRYEKPQAIDTVRRAIKDYLSQIEGDRFLQMYLSDSIFSETTLPHGYSEFKKVLKVLQGSYDIDRNKLWVPDFNPGYPKIISEQNFNGLKIVDIERAFNVRDLPDLKVNGVNLHPARLIPYDQRHFSRYNIFNINNPDTDYRSTKRVRIGDKAIKFYNNKRNGVKSIFSLSQDPKSLPSGTLLVIKLLVLRNKTRFRIISSVIGELVKNVGVLRDSIFLKNTVIVNPGSPIKANLTWYPCEFKEGYINISIL